MSVIRSSSATRSISYMSVLIAPPFVNENCPMNHLFELLQTHILALGYQLMESVRERVGHAIAESIRHKN